MGSGAGLGGVMQRELNELDLVLEDDGALISILGGMERPRCNTILRHLHGRRPGLVERYIECFKSCFDAARLRYVRSKEPKGFRWRRKP